MSYGQNRYHRASNVMFKPRFQREINNKKIDELIGSKQFLAADNENSGLIEKNSASLSLVSMMKSRFHVKTSFFSLNYY